MNKLKLLQEEQILVEEKAILSRDIKKNLYSKLTLNEKDQLSLEYETWIKHMQKEFKSLRLCEEDAQVHFKRRLPKYSKILNKMLFTKIE